ncbi:MAG TPA: alpha/beta hydrolase [Thermohalobaculum sp.]|nr:alpha/beta hydrolase [Thermohalobaculum sp.]
MRALLIRGALTAFAVWLIACAGLVLSARTLIYPFQPGFSVERPVGLPGAHAVTLTAADGTPLTVWLKAPAPGSPVVLYFMGNGGMLPAHAPLLAALAEGGYGIAALNYRGAGETPGTPSQEALTADALALYDGLDGLLDGKPAPHRVIWGTSLGAALAVQLAARRPAAALILESPFNRLCEVAQIHYPIFPVCLILPWERWDTADLIGTIGAPLLVLQGSADRIIPPAQGRRLYEAAQAKKRLIVYPDARHNDLPPGAAARDAAAFVAGLTG